MHAIGGLQLFVTSVFSMVLTLPSLQRVIEVINKEHKENSRGKKVFTQGDICFQNVSFKYKKENKQYDLQQIQVCLKEKESIGIIGGMGSSKSALVNILMRVYDVDSGDIRIGRNNIKEYDTEDFYHHIGCVLQKDTVFSRTIRENIVFGNTNVNDKTIEKVVRIARLYDVIQQLLKGLETKIQQGGTNLFGEQKQRICIARVLLKNSVILIIDDGTSAIDTITEKEIYQEIYAQYVDATKIIVSQKVKTIRYCDCILVFEKGKIVGKGTHQEL